MVLVSGYSAQVDSVVVAAGVAVVVVLLALQGEKPYPPDG